MLKVKHCYLDLYDEFKKIVVQKIQEFIQRKAGEDVDLV